MTLCIKELSSWFCFVYSTKEHFKLDFGHSHELPINQKRFEEVIFKLFEMYKDEFMPVVDQILNASKNDDFYFYMMTILPKCIKLSKTPTYLHFMLVCTFIRLIIWKRFQRQIKCFTFVKIASQCLVSVCNRCYKDMFKDKDDSKTFDSYCRRLNCILSKRMTAKGRKILSPFNKPKLVRLMADFNIKDKGKLELTDAELKMLNETLSFLPDKDSCTDDDDASTSRSVSDGKFLSEEISSNEIKHDGIYVNEEVNTNESESNEELVNQEVSTNESESDGESVDQEVDTNESEYDGVLADQEVDTNESESDGVLADQEVNTNESDGVSADPEVNTNESDGVSADPEVNTNETDGVSADQEVNTNESDGVSADQEVDTNESESDEFYLKEEVNTNESEYSGTSSEAESNSNDFRAYETSLEDSKTFMSTNKFKTDEDDSDDINRICKYCKFKCFEFVSSYGGGLFVKSDVN